MQSAVLDSPPKRTGKKRRARHNKGGSCKDGPAKADGNILPLQVPNDRSKICPDNAATPILRIR
jgi:hypothetical protein